MLVLCVGMYRACSTWQYGVAGQLLENFLGVQRLGFLDGCRFAAEVEPSLDRSATSILKVHDAHEHYAEMLAEGRAVAIYSYRDLRDVAFSWVHKTGRSFEEVVDSGFFDRCLRNDRFWRTQPNMLLQTYEDLIADPAKGVAEIARHLGVPTGEAEVQSIASAFSFEANRKRTENLARQLVASGVGLNSKDQDSYDRGSLLHWNHLRSGKVGDWREQATPEQRATLGRIIGPWLIEHGYEADDSWAAPAGPGEPVTAVPEPRVSYALNSEDILLDRLFQGRIGTFVDVGAPHPRVNNRTYFHYLRGWRGVNLEPASGARDCFESVRPGDYNIARVLSDVSETCSLYEIPGQPGSIPLSPEAAENELALGRPVIERRVPSTTVEGLVRQYHLGPPDLFSISASGDPGRILRGMPLASWQPKVFVIEANRPTIDTPVDLAWEPILLDHGYLLATSDGINRFYLRGDQAEFLPLLESPVNVLDQFERLETIELRSRADSLQSLLEEERRRTEEARARTAEVERDRAETISVFMSERDAWQRERDAWERERDAVTRERDCWQTERDAVQRERDCWQTERDAVQRERDMFQRERDSIQRERDGVQRERDDVNRRLAAQAEEIRHVRDELARLAFARDAELARFDQERQARALEAEEARIQLRPYRLIDRFGVVTALYRRARATKARIRSHR